MIGEIESLPRLDEQCQPFYASDVDFHRFAARLLISSNAFSQQLTTIAQDDELAIAPSTRFIVDAKHRLAYALTRAALIDLERDRPDSAVERAAESLDYARALDRVTEETIARVVLASAYRDLGDENQAGEQTFLFD